LTQLFAARGLIDRANYYRRIYATTASLFEMSTLAAAMVSTGEENPRSVLKAYGYQIGMAFQIMDDVLDFSGEQSTVGKPVGSDLLQGLVTLPAIYFAEEYPSDPDVKLLAEGGWGNQERMDRLINAIRNTNSITKAINEARTYVDKAVESLNTFPPSIERQELENLARYIVNRNS